MASRPDGGLNAYMIWIYRLLFLPVLILGLPWFARSMMRRGGYAQDFHHRFGFFPKLPPVAANRKRLWLQAVSVGEIQAIQSLLEQLSEDPGIEVVLTTTTSTGYTIAREKYVDNVAHLGIFPLDFWPFNALAWRRIRPDVIILMEGERWPEHLQRARRKQKPVLLLNARLSDRSFQRMQRFPRTARWLLKPIDSILAATEPDHDRFLALGVNADKLHHTGNLKLDTPIEPVLTQEERSALREELGFTAQGDNPCILLGCSTWPGEEAMLLDTLDKARKTGVDARLLLVPRHAERRDELAGLLKQHTFLWHQRTKTLRAPRSVDVYLADTTGELRRLCQVADVAFIGNSMPPNQGGQTPIECAALGIPMVFGPDMSNFRAIARSLVDIGAARQVNEATEAQATLLQLLQDKSQRITMARPGPSWHHMNRGATERTLQHIRDALKSS